MLATLLSSPVAAVSRDRADRAGMNSNERVAAAAGQYWNENPGDYAGLARAIEKAGGDTVRFTFPHARLFDVTGDQAQDAIREAQREESLGRRRSEAPVSTMAVPVDAFRVSSSWYHVQAQDGEWWTFNGRWNFRDNYVNGSAPDDASGIATSSMPSKCWRQSGDRVYAANYRGNSTSSAAYRRSATYSKSVWGLRDRVSGFVLNVDHGTHSISYRRVGYGCSLKYARGRYYYEHNQDGGGGWGFSITIAAFSLSYSGNSGSKLQKASALDYLR